jgi:single-strand DNA-binding protein
MNSVHLHGRLVRDPELKTAGGVEYCKFTVAVNRPVGKDKEKITDFLPCTAWRQTAAFVAQYFHQGDGIIVEGALHTRQYEKDGQKRTAFDIDVIRVEFAEKKERGAVGTNIPETSSHAVDPESGFGEVEDEELPF